MRWSPVFLFIKPKFLLRARRDESPYVGTCGREGMLGLCKGSDPFEADPVILVPVTSRKLCTTFPINDQLFGWPEGSGWMITLLPMCVAPLWSLVSLEVQAQEFVL